MDKKKMKTCLGAAIAIGLFAAFTAIMYVGNQKHYITSTDNMNQTVE